jgi:hypothetical protein
MEYSHLINDDEHLFRVTHFEVIRQGRRIKIDCIEVIEGKKEEAKWYMAAPYLLHVGNAKPEFIGYGKTEKDALCDCLGKIKDQPYNLLEDPVEYNSLVD